MSKDLVKKKISNLKESKSQNEKKILELDIEAKILKQKLHIED